MTEKEYIDQIKVHNDLYWIRADEITPAVADGGTGLVDKLERLPAMPPSAGKYVIKSNGGSCTFERELTPYVVNKDLVLFD